MVRLRVWSVLASIGLSLSAVAMPPRPGCGPAVAFERFTEVVLDKVLRHVIEEKNPDIWTEAIAGGPSARYRLLIDPMTFRITFVSPRGQYVVGMSEHVDKDRLGQLIDGELPRVLVRSNGVGADPTVISTVGIHPDWLAAGAIETAPNATRHLEHLRGLVRAAFAGDAFMHPQQRSPDAGPDSRLIESAIQQVTLAEMATLYRFSMIDDLGRALRLGLMAPGGIGKTFLCARFMRSIFKAQKLILVVDSNDILDQSRFPYAREFGLRVGELLTIYDNHTQAALDRTRNLLLINRTMLHRRWEDVIRWMGDARTGFVLDEAHHLGRNQQGNGRRNTSAAANEYREIFRRINTDARILANVAKQDPENPHYLALLASATFWHGDTDLIIDPDYLGVRNRPEGVEPYGKIYGPLLHDNERVQMMRSFGRNQQRLVDVGTEPEALRRGLATPEIARRQLLRAMGLGYLARLSHSDLHDDVIQGPGGEQLPAFEVVRRIDAQQLKIERTSIAYDLLERVYKQLVGMRTHTAGDIARSVPPETVAQLAPAPNRALVLVRRTQVANEVRDQLRAIAVAHGDRNTEVRTVHTGHGSDNREDTLAWFRNEGVYNTAAERAVNKILVVDQLVNEGVDVPDTNAVVLLRPFGSAEEGSIRRLIQIVTRASRTADFKTHMEIIDFSGASEHLRNILAIATQGYGGGGGGGGGGRTIIEVDIRPEAVDEVVNRISFINAQPTALSQFQNEADRWIAGKAPFDDPRVEGSALMSPLGVQIINLISTIPKRQLYENYYGLHEPTISKYGDNRLKGLIRRVGPRLFTVYSKMLGLHQRYLIHDLDKPGRNPAQSLAEAEIEREIREAWFEALGIVRDVDFYADREVTMSFSHYDRRDELSGAQLGRFFRRVLTMKDLPVLQDGDTGGGEVARFEPGRVREGAGDSHELVVRGPHAYSFLAGELGTHEVHIRDAGRPHTRFVFLRVTPPLDSRDPLWRHINDDHTAAERRFTTDPKTTQRRVYNNDAILRDAKLASLRIPLVRPTEIGEDIELLDNDDNRLLLGRMLRMNHYDYLRSTIQDVLVPALIRGRIGQ